MNDKSRIVSNNVSDVVLFCVFLLIHFGFELDCRLCLWKIDNSTLCLPLLYSATIHSTPTKAQKYISNVFKDNSVIKRLFSNIFMSYKKSF